MLSQQIKDTGALLDSVDAVRNWRALALLLATLVAAALVMGLGSLLAGVSFFLVFLFVLAAYAVVFYGANAVGMMMMDEARGLPSRPMGEALAQSLATSHRLILVFLLVFAAYVVGLIALALVLLLCKIPFLGPVLYTFVFPVAVVIAGIAMFALPTVVFPLSAPAIWNGAGALQCVSQLLAIARQRLLMVLILMVAVTFLAGIVAFLIGSILFAGTVTVAGMSAPILGGMAGMGALSMGGMGMAGMGGMGHAVAAGIGGGMLFAAAFALPGLVYLRGASTVYLRAIDGLDLVAEQAAMDERLAAARAKAGAVQEQVRARAQQAADRARAATAASAPMPAPPPAPDASPAYPAPPAPPVAPGPASPAGSAFPATVQAGPPTYAPPSVFTPPPTPGFGPASTAAPRCPTCAAAVQVDDTFCGECGHKLK